MLVYSAACWCSKWRQRCKKTTCPSLVELGHVFLTPLQSFPIVNSWWGHLDSAFPLIPRSNASDMDDTHVAVPCTVLWGCPGFCTVAEEEGCACAHMHDASRPPIVAASVSLLHANSLSRPYKAQSSLCSWFSTDRGCQDLTAGLLSSWPFPCPITYCDVTTTEVICRHAFIRIVYTCVLAHVVP